MATKKRSKRSKPKKATGARARKVALAAGKRVTLSPKPGYSACIVLLPVGEGPKGGIVFQAALRIGREAGKVSFVPRGKETLVIDAPRITMASPALQKIVRRVWARKGGPPTSVVD